MGNLIVKDNALIEASHRLGEVEQRLILLAILKARSQCNTVEQLQGKELMIHADDYIERFGGTQQGAYKALKKAVMGLYRAEWGYKFLNEKGNKVVRYERFTQSAMYIAGEGLVSFKFADAIIPMLVELERRFTIYEIGQVAQLSSQYAMRLYEFFMRHLDKKTGAGWLDISLDDLRFRLGLLPTEYALMSNFKKFVLDFSLKQINEKTDLSATYTQKKQGRTIVGFCFEFEKEKSTLAKQLQETPNTKDLFNNLTDQEREIVIQKQEYAHQMGITNPMHIKNLVYQGLERYRQAELEAKEQERAEQLAEQERLKEQERLTKLAQKSFELIKNNQDYLRQFCELNVKAKSLRGLEKFYFEEDNLEKFFLMQEKKFTDLNTFQTFNLSFLPQD